MKHFSFLEEHPYFYLKYDNVYWTHYIFKKDNEENRIMISPLNYDLQRTGLSKDREWFDEIYAKVLRKKEEITRLKKITRG